MITIELLAGSACRLVHESSCDCFISVDFDDARQCKLYKEVFICAQLPQQSDVIFAAL